LRNDLNEQIGGCGRGRFLSNLLVRLHEWNMKQTTALILLLALCAGILSVRVSAVPTVGAGAGFVGGMVYWTDQYDNVRPMAWAQVVAESGVSPPVVAHTTDGAYSMWLPEGTYDITASSSPGFYPETISDVFVSPGSSASFDFFLKPTGQPIPELPYWAQPLVLLSALLITAISVRRYRTRPRT